MTDEAELPDVWIDLPHSFIPVDLTTVTTGQVLCRVRYVPAARLDALRAELVAAQADAELVWVELEAELEATRADAERYRWLREAPPYSARWPRWRIEHWSGAWNPVQGSDMDAAIDAARKERT